MSSSVLPEKLYRVKLFQHRAEFTLQEDDAWKYTGGDERPLEDLINEWVDDTQALIHATSPPGTTIGFNHEKNVRVIYTTLAITYLPATEQRKDKTYGKTSHGNTGLVTTGPQPGDTAITAKLSDGARVSGGGVSGTS